MIKKDVAIGNRARRREYLEQAKKATTAELVQYNSRTDCIFYTHYRCGDNCKLQGLTEWCDIWKKKGLNNDIG